jgi:hypothetical protein
MVHVDDADAGLRFAGDLVDRAGTGKKAEKQQVSAPIYPFSSCRAITIRWI